MKKINSPLKYLLLLLLPVLISGYAKAQPGITGPTCVKIGTQYSYTLTNYATSFNYSVTGGTLSTGGTTGSHGVGVATILVTWSGSGSVNITSTSGNATLNVTASTSPAVSGGSITSGQTQSINYNTMPTTIVCSAATGGGVCGSYNYVYQWQSSPNNVTYTNISGATSQNLTFSSNLTSTTYYRMFVTETVSGNTGYSSNIATVTVYPQLVGGTAGPASQTINYNTSAALTLSGVSGGTNSYSYQWQSCADGVTWGMVSGATSTSYTATNLTSITYFRAQVYSNGVYAYSSSAVVNVNPQVLGGVLTPANIGIATGTSPGEITSTTASGGGCGGSYSYQWQSSTDGTNYTSISGATSQNYTPGNLTAATWYRRQVTCSGDVEYSTTCQVTIVSATPDMNFVRTRSILKAGVTDSATALALTSPYDVSQTTQYFDGLGRLVQTVGMQQSPLQKDLVSFNTYDNYGREANKYLPYTATTNDGNYKATAQSDQFAFNNIQYPNEQYYYGEVNFEPSPLNRAYSTLSPGVSWAGSSRGVAEQHLVNQAADSVRIWNIGYPVGSIPATTATYAAGTLQKRITVDEAGHQIVEYKDLTGHTVLKKVQLAASPGTAHVGWLCTYYVYDELDYLRFVIQPQAVALINSSWSISSGIANELCFRYEYDAHGHMIIKKIPGVGEAWMVYDIRDRVVMTQDSLLRGQQKWLFTRYDAQNRPDSTGLITDPANYSHLTYHDTTAFKTNNYPIVSAYANELLTQNYYDDYSFATAAGLSQSMATTMTSNSNYFYTSYNASPIYAANPLPVYIIRGMATGSMKKVIGTASQYLYSISYYDDRARVIQSQAFNYTGAIDTVTNQYDFTGKPIRNLLSHKKNGNTVQAHVVSTKMDYDQAFRLKHIWKNIDGATSDQLIDSMQYNELGQLRAKYIGNNIDSLVYDYNVRGWLTGINKNYVAGTTTHYFGMELGYDKTTSSAPGNTYAAAQYNGNIEGTVWKSAGSGTNRKYDFTYDNVNRLSAANFTQYNGSGFDLSAGIDFTTSSLSYDANGNILTMNQKGFMLGGSTYIDQLTYAYQSNSNKLSQVTDGSNSPTSQLGDFHYAGTKGSYDYSYDGNGNLSIDNNKAIDNIAYNYLNLPQLVHMNTKGNITYVYDASGTKLQKIIADTPANKKTVITYIAGFVYQNISTLSGSGTDTLQFISHEEGRARWAFHKYTTGTTAYKLEYDFFEKDHLGNIRMVLTQQRDTANYLASMEAAYRATESQLFANITTTGYPRASVAGYPNSTTITNPNDSVSKVDYNGTSGQKTGPSLLLKVMSGDTITMAVQSYYNTNTATMTNSSFSNVLSSLAAGLVSTAAGNAEGTLSGFTATTSPVYTGLNSFLTTNDPAAPAGYPKAYLNWIFLDDQFNYVSSSSGSVPAANSSHPAATLNTIAPGSPLNIAKNGYLYVWVSNETQNWDVFFDNLSVQHKQGAVLEEDHYYPFGLTMAGISDRAIKSQYPINKYLFNNGRELQNREFSDGNGLELYDAVHRMYDHQLGRFGQIDPLTDFTPNNSGYMYVGDNPMLYCDPLGLDTIKIFGEGEHHLKIKKGDVLSWQIGNNTSYYTYDPTNKDAVGGFVGEGIKEDYSRAVTVTPSAEQEAKRDQQKQEGAGFPWAASIGSGFSTADYGMFNEKTWFSLKKWQSYSQSWGGNGATGGKFKMAEKWAKGFRYTGWAFGAFNAVSIYRDKDMSGAQKWIEQGSNTFGTFGGIWGVAHTIGWESGRAISNNDWYRTNVRPVLQDALGVQRDEFLKLNYNIDAIGNTNNQ